MIENRYTISDEHIKEVERYLIFKNPQIIFLDAGAIAILLFETIVLVTSPHFWPYYTVTIVFAALIAALEISSYFRSVKLQRAREMEVYGGYHEVVITADEDSIIYSAGNAESIKLYFSQIKKIRRTKNMIIIISKAKMAYILRKDSFTKGSEDEFYDLVLENKVDVK